MDITSTATVADRSEKVVVNGKPVDIPMQVCTRCVQDTTVPGIHFDDKGVCNFCHLHDKMTNIYPNGEAGKKKLEEIERLKRIVNCKLATKNIKKKHHHNP